MKCQSSQKALAGSYIIPLLEYVSCHQLFDVNALLSSLGIKRSQLESSRFFLSTDQYLTLLTPILDKTDQHDLIQFLITGQNISQHGLLGLLSLCSFNLRQAINMLIRFHKLRSNLVAMEFLEEETHAIIRVIPTCNLQKTKCFTIEMALAALHTAKQQVLNTEHNEDTLYFTHPPLTPHHFLGENILYEQPYNQLQFPKTELDIKIKSTHKPTFDLLQAQCNDLLDQNRFDKQNIIVRVRDVMRESDEYFPTLTQVADQLALSPRTLSRHLKACDTTYQHILDEERIARAKQLLLDTDLTITEIAMYLHFTDASHFTKLFKHYMKQIPTQYRQQHKKS